MFLCLWYGKCVNTRVFARDWPKNMVNTCKYRDFCYQRRTHVNTVVLGFPCAKKIGIYGVSCSESLNKTWKHLFDDFWPLRKKLQGQQQQQQQQQQQGTNNKVQTITGTPSSSYISFCVYPLGYKQKLGPRRCYLAGVRSPTICISICIWRCIHLSNQIKPNQIKSNLSIYSIYLSSCMFLYIGRDLTQQLFSLSQWLGDVGSPTSPIGFTGVTISTHSPTSR